MKIFRILFRKLTSLDENDNIFLSTDKNCNPNKNEIVKTLLHEALHILFPKIREQRILRLEEILWDELSGDQQKMIKSYTPDYYVKIV